MYHKSWDDAVHTLLEVELYHHPACLNNVFIVRRRLDTLNCFSASGTNLRKNVLNNTWSGKSKHHTTPTHKYKERRILIISCAPAGRGMNNELIMFAKALYRFAIISQRDLYIEG
jgi:hypothetical protein